MANNDYILRSDAVSAFCGNCDGTEVCGQMGEPCDEVKRIKAIPAADVEPKRETGRWIEQDSWGDTYYTCSVCGGDFVTLDGESPEENGIHFCPMCGAKMDAEPPKEETVNEITPEMIEAAERNEKRIKERVDRIYDELIAEKRAEIERLEAEIAKMPPFDAEKLAAVPIVTPKEVDNGDKL